MSTTGRWAMAAVAVLLVLGLLVWARGEENHRGDEVGATSGTSSVTGLSRP